MSDKNRIKELLERLNQGTASDKELRELEGVLNQSKIEVEDLLKEDWGKSGEKGSQSSPYHSLIWKNVKEKIDAKDKANKRKSIVLQFSKVAAAVILLASIWWILDLPDDKPVDMVYVTNSDIPPKEIQLTDGSTVILNKGARISYPRNFEPEARDIHLTGKAFFQVNEDKERPFTVYTEHLSTTALGTSFIIDTGTDKDSINIALLTGKVRVQPEIKTHLKSREWLLNPGQSLSARITDTDVQVNTFEKELAMEWTRNQFDFDDRPLTEVLELLKKDRGIEFVYSPGSIDHCNITGQFDRFQDLDKILRLIFFSIDLEYKNTNEHRYEIYGEGCK